MPYPTPGFVVKQTFLELEDEGAPSEVVGPLPRMSRSLSDTNLADNAKRPFSKFGSDDMRLYWEEYVAQERRAAEAETPPQTPSASTPSPRAPDASCEAHGTEESAAKSELGQALAEMLRKLKESRAPGAGLRLLHREGGRWPGSPGCRGDGEVTPPHPQQIASKAAQQVLASAYPGSASNEEAPASSWPVSQSIEDELPAQDHQPEECTTLHLKELPGEYTRIQLSQLFDEEGFSGCYDFIYLPMDLRTRTGWNNALVNLRSHAEAQRMISHFHGFTSWRVKSSRVCEVEWSQYCQGLHALCERYRNSPIMHEAVPDIYKPKMYQEQVPVPLPPPTRRLRMPRLRKLGQRGALSGGAAAGDAASSEADAAACSSGDVWFVDLVASQGMSGSASGAGFERAWVPGGSAQSCQPSPLAPCTLLRKQGARGGRQKKRTSAPATLAPGFAAAAEVVAGQVPGYAVLWPPQEGWVWLGGLPSSPP